MTKSTLPIYTLTPNPALDLSGHVTRIVPNEKNYVFAERRDPGGNGINAARIIHRLSSHSGLKVTALGFTGGSTGTEIVTLLKKEGVVTRFTPIRAHTRINVTVNNDQDHRQTRLTFPGPQITRPEMNQLFKTIAAIRAPGLFILGGSLPQGCPDDFHLKIVRAAVKNGLSVIADVPAKYIHSLLRLKPRSAKATPPLLLIKPNQAELEEWVGRPLKTDTQILKAAQSLLHRHGAPGMAQIVCISLAEKGAYLLFGDRIWQGVAPKIRARGTVGAGDSMVGAISTCLAMNGLKLTDETLESALAWGLAAGAATAESVGTSLAQATEIGRLLKRVKVKRV